MALDPERRESPRCDHDDLKAAGSSFFWLESGLVVALASIQVMLKAMERASAFCQAEYSASRIFRFPRSSTSEFRFNNFLILS